MAKILMVNVPYAGHVKPTLPLTASLVKQGHSVTYINAPEWRAKIEATGAAFFPYLDYPEGLSEREKKRGCFLAAGRTVLSIGKGYDMLLYEMFFFPAKALADRLGIPAVRQFSQPAWNEATVPYAMAVSKLWRLSCCLINAQVVRLGIGRRMRPFFTNKRMLYANAMSVLSDESIHGNAMELQKQLAAEPGIEKALDAIECLLNGERKWTDGGGERYETAIGGRRKGDV